MKAALQQSLASLMAVAMLATASPVMAQEHVVPLSEMQNSARTAGQARSGNLADINRVLSLPQAQDALRKAQVNPDRMNEAIAQLDDQELSRLADRARAAEQDVQGGLIVGLLALIGLIVVIIIVVSLVS